MTDRLRNPADEAIAHRIAELLCAAQRRARQQRTGFGAYVTPLIPDRVIDEMARGFAPLLREMVDVAVAARLSTPDVA